MATRMSLLRYLVVALVAGIALSLAPTQPVHADEDPGYRAKRVRSAPAYRYYRPATRVRTVIRTRVVYVAQPVQPVTYTCGGCAPAPVYYNTCDTCAPAIAAPRYYGGCCGQSGAYYAGYGGYGGYVGFGYGAPYFRAAHRALPYYWAVRHARHYRHGRHAWHHRRWHY